MDATLRRLRNALYGDLPVVERRLLMGHLEGQS